MWLDVACFEITNMSCNYWFLAIDHFICRTRIVWFDFKSMLGEICHELFIKQHGCYKQTIDCSGDVDIKTFCHFWIKYNLCSLDLFHTICQQVRHRSFSSYSFHLCCVLSLQFRWKLGISTSVFLASVTAMSNVASVLTVWLEAFSWLMYSLWVLPFAQCLDLIL